VAALHIVIGKGYATPARRAIDKQLARAGFRLAQLLNSLLHD
jgi:hypothetical protein